MEHNVKLRFLIPALALAFGASACSKELATEPSDQVLAEPGDCRCANCARSARRRVFRVCRHSATTVEISRSSAIFQLTTRSGAARSSTSAKSAADEIKADNTTTTSVWTAIYAVIARSNMILTKVPSLSDLSTDEKNEILGEAYFLRALSYHNLAKYWGGLPLPLQPILVASDASKYPRVTAAQVYTQILGDLTQAEQLITNTSNTRQATLMAVHAIRSRVLFYNGDYQGSLDEAEHCPRGTRYARRELR